MTTTATPILTDQPLIPAGTRVERKSTVRLGSRRRVPNGATGTVTGRTKESVHFPGRFLVEVRWDVACHVHNPAKASHIWFSAPEHLIPME